MLRLEFGFRALLPSGLVVAVVGSYYLAGASDSWRSWLPPLAVLGCGFVWIILGMRANIRGRVQRAVLEENRRIEAGPRTSARVDGPRAEGRDPRTSPGPTLVDLRPFTLERQQQAKKLRPSVTLLAIAFAAMAGFLLFEAFRSATAGQFVSAVGTGVLGALVSAISVLQLLIVYAPMLPARPIQLEISSRGLQLTTTRGKRPLLQWDATGLRIFLLDTRPSVRRPQGANLPPISLYSRSLGEVPLTIDGARAVEGMARNEGFRVEALPQGMRGALPLGPRMRLPFGSIVSVIERRSNPPRQVRFHGASSAATNEGEPA